jgi:predicted ATPase
MLSALGRENIGTLIARATGASPSASFVETVHEATSGNPFLVSEFVRLAASGDLDPTKSAPLPVPHRVRAMVEWQLGGLSNDCRRALEAASVIGHEFDLATVAYVLHRSMSDVLASVREAESCEIVARIGDRSERFVFVHEVAREYIGDTLSFRDHTYLRRRAHESDLRFESDGRASLNNDARFLDA